MFTLFLAPKNELLSSTSKFQKSCMPTLQVHVETLSPGPLKLEDMPLKKGKARGLLRQASPDFNKRMTVLSRTDNSTQH